MIRNAALSLRENIIPKQSDAPSRATLSESASVTGVGIHQGGKAVLRLHPAGPGNGLVFRFRDGDLPISPFHVQETRRCTILGNEKHSVATVEHLLAALSVLGITDLDLEIDGPEIPALDGSAKPFYDACRSAGLTKLDADLAPLRPRSPVWVTKGESYIVALPHESFRVTYDITGEHELLHGARFSGEINPATAAREILPARTFGFARDLNALQAQGLALGASLENSLALTPQGYLNEHLRFPDECPRHKVLDLMGDLYLNGRALQAHVLASRAGHELHVALARKLALTETMTEPAFRT